jgi:hypothetical protein
VSEHIDEVQNALGRTVLLENPSTFVVFDESTWAETDFLREIARRTGSGLLLDVNNVFVSAVNHGFDPDRCLADFRLRRWAKSISRATQWIPTMRACRCSSTRTIRRFATPCGPSTPRRSAGSGQRVGEAEWVADIALDPPFLTLSLRDRLPLHRLAQRLGAGLVADDAARRQAGQPGEQERQDDLGADREQSHARAGCCVRWHSLGAARPVTERVEADGRLD